MLSGCSANRGITRQKKIADQPFFKTISLGGSRFWHPSLRPLIVPRCHANNVWQTDRAHPSPAKILRTGWRAGNPIASRGRMTHVLDRGGVQLGPQNPLERNCLQPGATMPYAAAAKTLLRYRLWARWNVRLQLSQENSGLAANNLFPIGKIVVRRLPLAEKSLKFFSQSERQQNCAPSGVNAWNTIPPLPS